MGVPDDLVADLATRLLTPEERATLLRAAQEAEQVAGFMKDEVERMNRLDKWHWRGIAALAWLSGFMFGRLWGVW